MSASLSSRCLPRMLCLPHPGTLAFVLSACLAPLAGCTITAGESAVDGGGAIDGSSDGSVTDSTASSDGGLDSGPDGWNDAREAATPCDASTQCGSLQCCSGTCVDTSLDPRNCGACGTACVGNTFCTGTECKPAILSNICLNKKGTVSLDAYQGDNGSGAALGGALTALCMPAPVITSVQQEAGILDSVTWRPATGVGNTFIFGGGRYGQLGVGYLDSNALTPVYFSSDFANDYFVNRKTSVNIVVAPKSNLDAHHDYFFVELAVEPISGTLCFGGVGMLIGGTLAAGYYASAQLIPNYATSMDSWFVYQWTDTNMDGVPNAGDTYTSIASGT